VFSLYVSCKRHTLLAFAAAERRAAAPLLVGARRRICRSISPARMALSSKPAARHSCGRMMGQMDAWTKYKLIVAHRADPA